MSKHVFHMAKHDEDGFTEGQKSACWTTRIDLGREGDRPSVICYFTANGGTFTCMRIASRVYEFMRSMRSGCSQKAQTGAPLSLQCAPAGLHSNGKTRLHYTSVPGPPATRVFHTKHIHKTENKQAIDCYSNKSGFLTKVDTFTLPS